MMKTKFPLMLAILLLIITNANIYTRSDKLDSLRIQVVELKNEKEILNKRLEEVTSRIDTKNEQRMNIKKKLSKDKSNVLLREKLSTVMREMRTLIEQKHGIENQVMELEVKLKDLFHSIITIYNREIETLLESIESKDLKPGEYGTRLNRIIILESEKYIILQELEKSIDIPESIEIEINEDESYEELKDKYIFVNDRIIRLKELGKEIDVKIRNLETNLRIKKVIYDFYIFQGQDVDECLDEIEEIKVDLSELRQKQEIINTEIKRYEELLEQIDKIIEEYKSEKHKE